METKPAYDRHAIDIKRLVAFIDGVYAVALTLLVLDLKLPSGSGDLPHALLQMLPGFLVYLIVFTSVAGYWTIQHYAFRSVAQGDTGVLLLSLLNVLFVTLYPVMVSIMGSHPHEPLATVCYSGNTILYCLSSFLLWSHVSSHSEFFTPESSPKQVKHLARILLIVAACILLAIPLAFVSVFFAYGIYILCSPLATILSRISRSK
jgi:uncharacterized membrane protein